jgi:hypothetical protein
VNRDLNDQVYLHIENLLTDPTYIRLFYWLMDLLLKVVEKQEVNFMDPKNLAIVWGPGMVGSSQDAVLSDPMNAMDGFNDTRFGINVIETNLTNMFRNQISASSVLKGLGLVSSPPGTPRRRNSDSGTFTLATNSAPHVAMGRSNVRKSAGARDLPVGILNEMLLKRKQMTAKVETMESQGSPVMPTPTSTASPVTMPTVPPKPEIPHKPSLPPKPASPAAPPLPPKPTSSPVNNLNSKDLPPSRAPPRPPK